jgi:hypothetical protein
MIHITKIYLVTNCYNDPNKVYIGKTKTSRKLAHKYKFGSQITYDCIDEISSVDRKDWVPLESYWIHQFKQWGFDVLNKNEGGGGPEAHSEKTKQKMKENSPINGKSRSKEIKNKISNSNKGKNGKPKGFITSDETKFKISNSNKGNTHSLETKQKISDLKKDKPTKKSTPVLQFSVDGEFIKEWGKIKEASTSLGKALDTASITCCCKGKQKTAFGFIWKYKN